MPSAPTRMLPGSRPEAGRWAHRPRGRPRPCRPGRGSSPRASECSPSQQPGRSRRRAPRAPRRADAGRNSAPRRPEPEADHACAVPPRAEHAGARAHQTLDDHRRLHGIPQLDPARQPPGACRKWRDTACGRQHPAASGERRRSRTGPPISSSAHQVSSPSTPGLESSGPSERNAPDDRTRDACPPSTARPSRPRRRSASSTDSPTSATASNTCGSGSTTSKRKRLARAKRRLRGSRPASRGSKRGSISSTSLSVPFRPGAQA